jgi:AGZA family xanthine/uracil permease-like MFS transporter
MTEQTAIERKTDFWGEFSAFLALLLDNIGTLVFFSSILIISFHFPPDLVLTRMLPGTALGVLFGDLAYSWLAIRLRKKTGRRDVTAMPLGLDTPSTIGIAYAVLGPAYIAAHDAVLAWKIGMTNLFIIGLVKIITSFLGRWVQRVIPTAGLLGAIAGIGLLFLGFLPLVEVFNAVVVGMIALGLMFYVLIGRMELPYRLPGILVAVLLGSALYHLLGTGGFIPDFEAPSLTVTPSVPHFGFRFFSMMPETIQYLPIAIPFGIMTIIGGINNTESARLAGDDYRVRDILLTEAFSTLIASFFGGVAQTTPYIGHPAYKKMGATCWYTLGVGIFIGLGAMAGFLMFIMGFIPKAVIAPIFIFIGFEIVIQAYTSVEKVQWPAVTFSFFPTIAYLVCTILGQFLPHLSAPVAELPSNLKNMYQTLTFLGNGFILTAMLWGGMFAYLIDKRPRMSALYALACAAAALFGFIHSIFPSGEVYLPWNINGQLHVEIALAYLVVAGIFFGLGMTRK